MDERVLEEKIRKRAYRIWEEEGRPGGREIAHWELAKLAVAQEDAQASMLLPIEKPHAERVEAVVNQGEFPALTDQGEQRNPGDLAAETPLVPTGAR
jgi:Protein of unknown function (DUF2934)